MKTIIMKTILKTILVSSFLFGFAAPAQVPGFGNLNVGTLTIVTPAPPAWTPNDITGLKAWWKADYYSLSDNVQISNVWATSGGPSRDATPYVTYKPYFRSNIQNGLPMIAFTNTALTEFNFTLEALPSFTVFIVFSKPTDGGSYSGPLNWAATGTAGFSIVNDAAGTTWQSHLAKWGGSSESSNRLANSLAIPVGVHLECWKSDMSFQRDGTNITSTVAGGGYTIPNATGRIGVGYAYHTGYIGEIVVYDSVLSSNDTYTVTAYLRNRWGL